MYDSPEVSRYIDVDIGERVIYASVAIEIAGGDESEITRENVTVRGATMERGREFRHHRERLKTKKSRLQKQGNLLSDYFYQI